MISAPPATTRSRVDTEEKLISATAQLLGEIGPRALSVRAIAERAGVNHGLVHHYFGGKDALLQAAMERLVHEHFDYAMAQSKSQPLPAPLGLVGDPTYLKAVVRAVLDNEMSLAETELTEDVSVPRNVLRHISSTRGESEPSLQVKASVGLGMALEMGWAALEPFIFAVVGAENEQQQEELRLEARRLRSRIMSDIEVSDSQ